jgi:hypothetical protein
MDFFTRRIDFFALGWTLCKPDGLFTVQMNIPARAAFYIRENPLKFMLIDEKGNL